MKIGVPKEIKNNENRVGLVPAGVRQLVEDGHEVFVEQTAGLGIGISDDEYIKAGAKMLPSLEDVFEQSEMIIKVKEPQPRVVKQRKFRWVRVWLKPVSLKVRCFLYLKTTGW